MQNVQIRPLSLCCVSSFTYNALSIQRERVLRLFKDIDTISLFFPYFNPDFPCDLHYVVVGRINYGNLWEYIKSWRSIACRYVLIIFLFSLHRSLHHSSNKMHHTNHFTMLQTKVSRQMLYGTAFCWRWCSCFYQFCVHCWYLMFVEIPLNDSTLKLNTYLRAQITFKRTLSIA